MNIYEFPRGDILYEIVDKLAQGENVRVERIISAGHTTDWCEQEQDELVILVAGNAELEFEGGYREKLRIGDTLHIKAQQKHRVRYTSESPPCVWICIFFNSLAEQTE